MSQKTRNLIIALGMLVLLCYLAFHPDGGRGPSSGNQEHMTVSQWGEYDEKGK